MSISNITINPLLHTSIAEAVFNEISTRSSRYFYFLGRTLEWYDELTPPKAIDHIGSEKEIRRDIIFLKEVKPSDVSFIIPRYNWSSNVVYDMFDDRLGDGLIGVNIISGGSNYTANVSATVNGGGGSGAVVIPTTSNGIITGFTVNFEGSGYNTAPTITITDSVGTGASATGVIAKSFSGAQSLQESQFYVMTDDFNIYKCLDNNGDSLSTVKPADITVNPLLLADGYKWKYMATIQPGKRNKFLTEDYIPVTTSINSKYYGRGTIKNVRIDNTGDGYTFASIQVDGDGYLEEDPVYIVQAVIANSGNNYTSANIIIDPPVSFSTSWSNNTPVFSGVRIEHEDNIYEIVIPGSTGANGPVHTVGTAQNGSAGLKYLGTVATGNVAVVSNIISSVTLDGLVREIIVTDGGSGYITPPSVTISGGGGSGAAGYAAVSGGNVNRIYLTNLGRGYSSIPTVLVGTSWIANTITTLNQQLFFSDRLYTVTLGSGNASTFLGSVAPTHTSGNVLSGNATLTFAGNAASASALLKFGSGYTRAPNVTVSGNGSNAEVDLQVQLSEAFLIPNIVDGKIVSVTVENGGVDFSEARLLVVGDGSNASLQVDFSEGDFSSIQSNTELQAKNGTLEAIRVISSGVGYTSANVVITGDGSGATASAAIIGSKIYRINIITPGQNYTFATINISGDGYGASARAILPPTGGHGKNIIYDLYSDSLMFFSSIAGEKNQGLVVNNDYRQFGIVKELLNYDGNRYFVNAVGSACWVITGSGINPAYIIPDTILTSTRNASYVIVAVSGSSLLVQSRDEIDPIVGDILSIDNTFPFIVTGITAPGVDKYSGRFLYSDNRQAFTSTEQSISIKTVFKY